MRTALVIYERKQKNVNVSFEFSLATIVCHSNNSSNRKRSRVIKNLSLSQAMTLRTSKNTVVKLKSLKTLLAIIGWLTLQLRTEKKMLAGEPQP